MSNSGPAPLVNRNSGLGWKMSGPMYCITVWADNGSPMSPRAIARRAVCTPGPSTVSGATPTSSPAASAFASSSRPLSRSTLIGFSDQTCLPASIASPDTCAWTAGMVRFTTSSTSGCSRRRRRVPTVGPRASAACEPGQVGVQVTEDDHVDVGEPGEVVQIGVADHAGADETDADGTRPGCAHRTCLT